MELLVISIAIGAAFLYCARDEAKQSAQAATEAEAAQHLHQAQRLRLIGRILCVAIPVIAFVHAVLTFEFKMG
jgi:hypothetical protein